MSNFVTIDEDKFEKKTTYQNTKHLNIDDTEGIWESCYLNYRRLVIMPDHDSLLMDIEVHSSLGNDWPNLNAGKIIMLIDGETVTIDEVYENWHDCDTHDGTTFYKESVYFELDKKLLKRICDSKSFCMQVYGGNLKGEVENVNAVVVYSKLFYNAVYDNTAYTDVVANALEEFTRSNADMSSFSKIALDGSGANGGCMGMIALMITLTGAAVGGLCALV